MSPIISEIQSDESDEFTQLIFFINGKKVVESDPDPRWTLLYYLRNRLKLCGTKEGCGVGGCGACTVMISRINRDTNHITHLAVNACITPVCSLHGAAVTSVEGIGSTKTKLHPIQERLAKSHGSQCGFCTPGFVMSMYALMRSKPDLKMEDIEEAFQGNLCRCTGYRPILAGMESFTTEWEQNRISQTLSSSNGVCGLGANCCKNGNNQNCEKNMESIPTEKEQNRIGSSLKTSNVVCGLGEKCCKNKRNIENGVQNGGSLYKPYDGSQEAIFPPELKLNPNLDRQKLRFCKDGITWIRPTSLKQLTDVKFSLPHCKIVSGNTEIGIETKFGIPYSVLVNPVLIRELHKIERFPGFISVGGTVSLTELKNFIANELRSSPAFEVGVLREIHDMLHWFAGKQVRNVATVAGNIVTSSPISDLSPLFLATKVRLNLLSKQRGCRKVVIDKDFFIGYRKNVIQPDEIVVSFEIPLTGRNQFVKAYKQARRREDDISIVTAAFNAYFDEAGRIQDIRFGFGGMSQTTVLAQKTAKKLIGRKWNEDTLDTTIRSLIEELSLDALSPGGMAGYRTALCPSLFMKFYVASSVWLQKFLLLDVKIDNNILSAADGFDYKFFGGSQLFEINLSSQPGENAIGKPIIHASAFKQTAGEAIYGDDVALVDGELFAELILSKRAHAIIVKIDPSEALKLNGVIAFYCYDDIEPNKNVFGLNKDEKVFAAGKVNSFADVVGVVVAESKMIARSAAKLVHVEYDDLPFILTLEEAIKRQSFYFKEPVTLRNGDVANALSLSKHILEGTCRSGAQEHFYLEPYFVRVHPKEDEVEVISGSQHPSQSSGNLANLLDLPINKIVTKVKRIGGAFGGKESRTSSLTLPVAFAAYKLRKPVRCCVDRAEDMQFTGNRHPFKINYKVGFDERGKILAAEFDLYNNAGCTLDYSAMIMTRAVVHIDNIYNIPNIAVNGYVCKTNLPSNTAFRGFGAPQGMLAAETMIRDIAHHLDKDYLEVMELNMYKEGDLTHMNQQLENCNLQRCWNECLNQSDYHRRKEEVKEFNRHNRWKKKGLSVVSTKYAITFGVDLLMQASAYVMIYVDGSVLINIGGVEMGQGLFTKMIQIASRVFEVNTDAIHISESSTDKLPNQGPTAASMGSDIYGMAVLDACTKLQNRLKPYKEKDPKGNFRDWAMAAWLDRASLAATGHYKAEPVTYDMVKNEGRYAEYYSYGTAVSEVIIDCLSGDHQVLRTDIVMDLGESLNPAIDIGQIEGAFAQGYGFFMLEEVMVSPTGKNISNGPSNYKIPSAGDIPREFNVSLLRGTSNPRAVYASKAIGEPPLFLASSVFFAVKDAISSARRDAGVDANFVLSAPATCEKIRMACVDHVTSQVDAKSYGQSWFIVA